MMNMHGSRCSHLPHRVLALGIALSGALGACTGGTTVGDVEPEPGKPCTDQDQDGRGHNCAAGTDCDDSKNEVFQLLTGYVDGDRDGYGAGSPQSICSGQLLPEGYASTAGDCDESDPAVTLCTEPAVLTWEAPLKRADGTTLDRIGGYRVHYGTFSRNGPDFEYEVITDIKMPTCVVNGSVTECTHTMTNLPGGQTYYFAVTAYDDLRPSDESAWSNEASKSIP